MAPLVRFPGHRSLLFALLGVIVLYALALVYSYLLQPSVKTSADGRLAGWRWETLDPLLVTGIGSKEQLTKHSQSSGGYNSPLRKDNRKYDVRNITDNSAALPLSNSLPMQRGIVMCTSDDMFMLAGVEFAIETIRDHFKSTIPITIAHCAELSSQTQRRLTDSHSRVYVHDLCPYPTSIPQKQRLRGWFCKPAALVRSGYQETMLVDVDTVWFESPEKLFDTPGYQSTGALFFRDRLLFESPNCGLSYPSTKRFIELHTGINITPAVAATLVDSTYFSGAFSRESREISSPSVSSYSFSYYWRHGVNSSQYPAHCHAQESSVVMLDRLRMPKTIEVMKALIPTFKQGYGDKEIYWIAATIAKESYAWEPFLAGAYGDCGEIVHYDPRRPFAPALEAKPFFMNGQYLAEDVSVVGKGLSHRITIASPAADATTNFQLGPFNKSTSGRCGACEAMGGCTVTPPEVNDAVLRMQTYQHKNAPPKTGFNKKWYYFIRRVKSTLWG